MLKFFSSPAFYPKKKLAGNIPGFPGTGIFSGIFVYSRYIFCALLLIVIFLGSCDSKMAFEQNKPVPGAVWSADKKIIFETYISDTISPYNLYINIRNTGNFQFSNLYIFVDVFMPDGKIERDTIECILADAQGRWLGKSGSGSVWDNQILFNRKTRFPRSGKYVFRFEQAMRQKELEHIMEVGLRVEKEE